MKIKQNRLRSNIRLILKEFLFTSMLPKDGDDDDEEYSIAKRIGGGHTSHVDWSDGGWAESDDYGLEEEEEEEDGDNTE